MKEQWCHLVIDHVAKNPGIHQAALLGYLEPLYPPERGVRTYRNRLSQEQQKKGTLRPKPLPPLSEQIRRGRRRALYWIIRMALKTGKLERKGERYWISDN